MNKTIAPNETEISELRIFTDNDGDIYRLMVVPVIRAMVKRIKEGTYDRTKALKSWGMIAEQGAKKYTTIHCSHGDKWHQIFSKPVRDAVAEEMEAYHMVEYKLGNYDSIWQTLRGEPMINQEELMLQQYRNQGEKKCQEK